MGREDCRLHYLDFSRRLMDDPTLSAICRISSLPDFRGNVDRLRAIEDLLQLCRTQGWSRLYWHTRNSNREASRLYDHFVNADDFVRYRMILTRPEAKGRRPSRWRPFNFSCDSI